MMASGHEKPVPGGRCRWQGGPFGRTRIENAIGPYDVSGANRSVRPLHQPSARDRCDTHLSCNTQTDLTPAHRNHLPDCMTFVTSSMVRAVSTDRTQGPFASGPGNSATCNFHSYVTALSNRPERKGTQSSLGHLVADRPRTEGSASDLRGDTK